MKNESKTERAIDEQRWRLPEGGHRGLTQRSWRWVRQGLARCRANTEDLGACLDVCRKNPGRYPVWLRILEGRHEDMVEIALATEDYFALSPPAMAWWDSVVQNHPFALFIAPERRAQQLRRRTSKVSHDA